MSHVLFVDRIGVLATMHRKETVIAPIVESKLGIRLIIPDQFDTDQFGTFTRERDRPGNQREAARLKAEKALELTGELLAFASEGTFAPHPNFPAIPCNRELVLLFDRVNKIEIIGQAISTETNYNHQTVKTVDEAFTFAKKVGFPMHGLVVMLYQNAKQPDGIIKGITDEDQLIESVEKMLGRSQTGMIHLETDMRALYNPTRLKVIEQATLDLIANIQRTCPDCGCPGFELTERRIGLPCGLCGLPTALTRSTLYTCQKCGFQQEILLGAALLR
jgi:hypothetical protein